MRVYFHGKTLNNIDRNHQDVDQAAVFVKQWFAAGAHCCRLRKTSSAHCYLGISVLKHQRVEELSQRGGLRFVVLCC